MQAVSAQELAKHNTEQNAWVAIHGNVYDVTEWINNHPGGSSVMQQALGKEITYLFESSHLSLHTSKILGTAKVPLVGTYEPAPEEPCYTWPSPFYTDLKTKINAFLKENKHGQRTLSFLRIIDALFIAIVLIGATHLTFYSTFSLAVRFGFAMVAGLFVHLYLTHVAHDICHSSFSSSPLIWSMLCFASDFLVGHSHLMWIYRHNYGHHVHTNTPVADPDISYYHTLDPNTIFYRAPLKVQLPQWLKPVFYTVATILMKLEDMVGMIKGAFGTAKMNKPSTVQTVHFWIAKSWVLFYRLILPIVLGQHWFQVLALAFVMEATSGVVFGLFSQVNHVNTDCPWQQSGEPKDWAITQVRTSIDYSHGSFLWTYLSGFLNHQIAHHLFPTLNPHLYPSFSPIIRQVCKEHNVEYIVKPSFLQAVFDHFDQLDLIAKDI